MNLKDNIEKSTYVCMVKYQGKQIDTMYNLYENTKM